MKVKHYIIIAVGFVISACAGVQQQQFQLKDGSWADYIHGKVDADGQTGVFRDVFINGRPVMSHFAAGQSLTGQVLQGTASSAMLAGGMVGAAALLRPTRVNEHNSMNNSQDQDQGQASFNDSSASSESSSSSKSWAANHNANINKIKVEDIGSGGGVPGCQKAKFGC